MSIKRSFLLTQQQWRNKCNNKPQTLQCLANKDNKQKTVRDKCREILYTILLLLIYLYLFFNNFIYSFLFPKNVPYYSFKFSGN